MIFSVTVQRVHRQELLKEMKQRPTQHKYASSMWIVAAVKQYPGLSARVRCIVEEDFVIILYKHSLNHIFSFDKVL